MALYHSLVFGGALPLGYEKELILYPGLGGSSGARRGERISAAVTNADAAVQLNRFTKQKQRRKGGQDGVTPVRAGTVGETTAILCKIAEIALFRTGQHGRKMRRPAVSELAALLKGTVGRLLVEKLENATLLGGGRRASTLLPYPTERSHLTDFRAARQSEPCIRSALKGAYHGQAFVEEIAGVKLEERFTSAPIFTLVYKELPRQSKERSHVKRLACTLPCLQLLRRSSVTPGVFVFTGNTLGGFRCRSGVFRESSSAKSHSSGHPIRERSYLPTHSPTTILQNRQRLRAAIAMLGSLGPALPIYKNPWCVLLTTALPRTVWEESETTQDFLEHLGERCVEQEETTRNLALLERWQCSDVRKLVLVQLVEQLADADRLVPDVDDPFRHTHDQPRGSSWMYFENEGANQR